MKKVMAAILVLVAAAAAVGGYSRWKIWREEKELARINQQKKDRLKQKTDEFLKRKSEYDRSCSGVIPGLESFSTYPSYIVDRCKYDFKGVMQAMQEMKEAEAQP
jgi:hypothetical protein